MTKLGSFGPNEIILGLPGVGERSCCFNRKELLCEYLKRQKKNLPGEEGTHYIRRKEFCISRSAIYIQ